MEPRRVLIPLRRCAGGALCLLLLLGLCYALYVQVGGPAPELPLRARGCMLCHDLRAPLPLLRSKKPGEPLRPLLQERLSAAHPLLSRGAVPELADYLATAQLPALAELRAGAPGQALYLAKCAVCHGRTGEGLPGEYPPLRSSAWLTDEPSRLPEILTRGLSERIEVRGEVWDKTMRPPGISSPQEVQLIIEYLKAELK